MLNTSFARKFRTDALKDGLSFKLSPFITSIHFSYSMMAFSYLTESSKEKYFNINHFYVNEAITETNPPLALCVMASSHGNALSHCFLHQVFNPRKAPGAFN